ncbi:sensor histidine kinase [Chitinophaga qingshengii]|uniref:Sensor histidine kinase n=1 Tax=Chitinophaga qingshengii TaxID=1569794 RepID=A0ABR7TFU6_9BACT|nr:histidine kinase [Chitinophaga qingshengii]MBC9929256.1 sensor histidine kinase [Chitinophaga qingshengii]
MERKKYIIILHILFWVSVPFMLTFVSWSYQFTAFVPVKGGAIRSYAQVLYETLLLNAVVLLVGTVTFYTIESICFSMAAGTHKKWGIPFKILLLSAWPALIVILLSYVSFAVAWSFKYFLLTAYLSVIPFALMGILSFVLKKLIRTKGEMLLLEKANVMAQLELVKSKTDPHFLFNTINNIDSLLSDDPAAASVYLNKLSGLLRFILYESSTNEKIPLRSEVNYITEYINLEKIRSINQDFVKFNIEGSINGHMIAPMVLIPILENAFKHVGSRTTTDAIVLDLNIKADEILFRCRNIYNAVKYRKSENGGLGWGLIRQRLDLQYGGHYQLEVNKDGMYYDVRLKLF